MKTWFCISHNFCRNLQPTPHKLLRISYFLSYICLPTIFTTEKLIFCILVYQKYCIGRISGSYADYLKYSKNVYLRLLKLHWKESDSFIGITQCYEDTLFHVFKFLPVYWFHLRQIYPSIFCQWTYMCSHWNFWALTNSPRMYSTNAPVCVLK